MEVWKKSNDQFVELLFVQINVNLKLYHRLLQEIDHDDFSNLLLKLKMQMDLFIKELGNIFMINNTKILKEHASIIDKNLGKISSPHDSENNIEGYLKVISEREKHLYKLYDELLLNAPTDEIAKMIIRNHYNEVNRNIQSIKDLREKIKLLKAS
jgi:hypothetical protein